MKEKVKSTIISMFIVLIVMITVPMLLFGEGDFMQKLGFGNGSGDLLEDLRAKAPKNLQSVVTDEEVEVYKWVDEHGVTQFSNTPPLTGDNSEKVVLSPDTNVISAVKIPEKEQAAVSKQDHDLGSPYSLGGMKKMIDTAGDIQGTVNQRKATQDAALKGLFKK